MLDEAQYSCPRRLFPGAENCAAISICDRATTGMSRQQAENGQQWKLGFGLARSCQRQAALTFNRNGAQPTSDFSLRTSAVTAEVGVFQPALGITEKFHQAIKDQPTVFYCMFYLADLALQNFAGTVAGTRFHCAAQLEYYAQS